MAADPDSESRPRLHALRCRAWRRWTAHVVRARTGAAGIYQDLAIAGRSARSIRLCRSSMENLNQELPKAAEKYVEEEKWQRNLSLLSATEKVIKILTKMIPG